MPFIHLTLIVFDVSSSSAAISVRYDYKGNTLFLPSPMLPFILTAFKPQTISCWNVRFSFDGAAKTWMLWSFFFFLPNRHFLFVFVIIFCYVIIKGSISFSLSRLRSLFAIPHLCSLWFELYKQKCFGNSLISSALFKSACMSLKFTWVKAFRIWGPHVTRLKCRFKSCLR